MGGEEIHMDLSNRGGGQPTAHQNQQLGNMPVSNGGHKNKSQMQLKKWGITAFGAAVVLLILGLALLVGLNSPKSQAGYVNSTKLQAVFLNTGQVYFGNIANINPQFLVLTNIFYLQTNNASGSTATSNTNVSLVKLGCELHAPYDQMVINMTQVTFWENLQSTGQVAKAVVQYQHQYPHGQTCSDQSSSSGSTTSSVQNAPTSSTPTTVKKP